MVAVAQNDGNTILFQVNKNFEIIFYESRTPSERIPRKKYDMNTLKIKGKSIKVNPKLPIISAVAFTHPESCGGKAQVKATSLPIYTSLLTLQPKRSESIMSTEIASSSVRSSVLV